jgi:hypothetical protein
MGNKRFGIGDLFANFLILNWFLGDRERERLERRNRELEEELEHLREEEERQRWEDKYDWD